jgi:hypothetical protein
MGMYGPYDLTYEMSRLSSTYKKTIMTTAHGFAAHHAFGEFKPFEFDLPPLVRLKKSKRLFFQ